MEHWYAGEIAELTTLSVRQDWLRGRSSNRNSIWLNMSLDRIVDVTDNWEL